MKLRRKRMLDEAVELNITAFLNLMVILVPFLLITAVFSRMTVLELTLPGEGEAQAAEETLELELQLVVYAEAVEIRDARLGRIRQFAVENGAIDWQPVVEVLLQIKQRFPDEQQIALLLDKAVPYKRLIEAMDQVRSTQVVNVASLQTVELFPVISVGEAPAPEDSPTEIDVDALGETEPSGADSDSN